ncbi:putative IRK-interacting protein [Dioscorea sansibarensis]
MPSSLGPQPHKISRQEVQAAAAKNMELRALHAALFQAGSTSSPSLQSLPATTAAASRASNHFSAEDYPVFTPNYEEEPLPGHHYISCENQKMPGNWSGLGMTADRKDAQEVSFSERTYNRSSLLSGERHACSEEDHTSSISSCINQMTIMHSTPGADVFRSRHRNSSGEFTLIAASNRCKLASISRENESEQKSLEKANNAETQADIKTSMVAQTKNRGPVFSWLFPKGKKKPKSSLSPNTLESEDMSQLLKNWGVFSLESLKKQLLEANESKEAALTEVSEMKSSLSELKQKLVSLEMYCEELKRALKQALRTKETQILDGPNLSKRSKSSSSVKENTMPVSHEVMVEGFLQMVSEARLSVKQFCKTLIKQIEEADPSLMDKLKALLQPYHVTSSSKFTKGMSYHLEALINQNLYQDFENCMFQKNGSQKILDPHLDRLENFSSFVALRNLSWQEVLRKGTKYYSGDFSRFCDQKMSGIVSMLDWSSPWPEQLLQSFFVSAKCIWLLHLLSFSFNPPLMILRVEENRNFDPLYMEDLLHDRQRQQAPARVKIMVMPGFYVEEQVLRCRVLCRYRSIT